MVIDQELREDVDKFLSKVKSEIIAPDLDDKEKPLEDNSDALITKDDQLHNVSSNTGIKGRVQSKRIGVLYTQVLILTVLVLSVSHFHMLTTQAHLFAH